MFRSERMYFYEILFGRDSAYQILDCLGKMEIVQFVNLNRDILRATLHNLDQIKACEEVIGKISQVGSCLKSVDQRMVQDGRLEVPQRGGQLRGLHSSGLRNEAKNGQSRKLL